MNIFTSKCCKAEAHIAIGLGQEKTEFICTKCDKPCDILPLEKTVSSIYPPKEEDDFDWTLKITRVENGYVMEGRNQNGVPTKKVVEELLDDELGCHETMLWEVMEYFNFQGSKHDKERLFVVRKKKCNGKQK